MGPKIHQKSIKNGVEKSIEKKTGKFELTSHPGRSIGGLAGAPGRGGKGTFRVRQDSGNHSGRIPRWFKHAKHPGGVRRIEDASARPPHPEEEVTAEGVA